MGRETCAVDHPMQVLVHRAHLRARANLPKRNACEKVRRPMSLSMQLCEMRPPCKYEEIRCGHFPRFADGIEIDSW